MTISYSCFHHHLDVIEQTEDGWTTNIAPFYRCRDCGTVVLVVMTLAISSKALRTLADQVP